MAFFINIVLLIAIMYFVLILPQRREAKRHREMLAALRPGEQVVTAGGVVGDIVKLDEEMVTLKSGESRLVVERARIARRLNPPAGQTV
jgi:preprotein translocase subunit YajC